MKVVDVSCQVVGSLLTSWYDNALTDVETDGYEQHMLLCPPCLAQAGKLRAALSALTELAAAPAVPSVDLATRLAAIVNPDPGEPR